MKEDELTLVEKFGLLTHSPKEASQEEPRFSPTDEAWDDEERGDYRAFVVSRMRGVPAIEFRFKSGDSEIFAYSHLYRISFVASGGLALTFSDDVVEVMGVRLGELKKHLLRQQVIRICEADAPTAKLAGDDEAVVTAMRVVGRNEELVD